MKRGRFSVIIMMGESKFIALACLERTLACVNNGNIASRLNKTRVDNINLPHAIYIYCTKNQNYVHGKYMYIGMCVCI